MSDALRNLQEKCGTTADGSFGPNTARAIAKHYEWSPERGAHMLGQLVHESNNFKATTENLNYSAKALLAVHPRYFKTTEKAEEYERQPQKIANYIYMDEFRTKKGALGNVNENDGWAFRGRGFLQCTGRSNYRAFASAMRIPEVMDDPSLVATDYAMESAIWFFDRNNIWRVCDQGVTDEVIEKVTRIINGGTKGLDHRKKETKKIYGWLNE